LDLEKRGQPKPIDLKKAPRESIPISNETTEALKTERTAVTPTPSKRNTNSRKNTIIRVAAVLITVAVLVILDDWPFAPTSTETPTTLPAAAPENPIAGVSGFEQLHTSDWFFSDVNWAYHNGFVVAVNNSVFAPHLPATQAMLVTDLARLAKVDGSEYTNFTIHSVPEDAWYTPFAKWAYKEGLFDGAAFEPDAEIARADTGVLLVKLLDLLGVPYTMPADPIVFSDEDALSGDAAEALHTLHEIGIFKGSGNNRVDPKRAITRSEWAALLHRMDTFISENQQ
jgi:hypothetical protein